MVKTRPFYKMNEQKALVDVERMERPETSGGNSKIEIEISRETGYAFYNYRKTY